MEKFLYKTKRYDSKLELMSDNNLTPDRFKSLVAMGRIQKANDNDMVDFAGVHIPQENKYEFDSKQFKNLKDLCMGLNISSRTARTKIKKGEITKLINEPKEANDGRRR
jgi:hypothetical protein